jgi:hypothetical protein
MAVASFYDCRKPEIAVVKRLGAWFEWLFYRRLTASRCFFYTFLLVFIMIFYFAASFYEFFQHFFCLE